MPAVSMRTAALGSLCRVPALEIKYVVILLIAIAAGAVLEWHRRKQAAQPGTPAPASPEAPAVGPGRNQLARGPPARARGLVRAIQQQLGAPARADRAPRVQAGGRAARGSGRPAWISCCNTRMGPNWALSCAAFAALARRERPQRGARSGGRAVRPARALGDVFRARIFPDGGAAAAGRRRGGRRQGMVARQPDSSAADAGLFRAPRRARRRRRVRLGARRAVRRRRTRSCAPFSSASTIRSPAALVGRAR